MKLEFKLFTVGSWKVDLILMTDTTTEVDETKYRRICIPDKYDH